MPTRLLYTLLWLLVLCNLFNVGLPASRENETSRESVATADEIVAGRVDEMESELEEALAGRREGDAAAKKVSSMTPVDNTSLTVGDKHRSPPLSVSVVLQSLSTASPAAANALLRADSLPAQAAARDSSVVVAAPSAPSPSHSSASETGRTVDVDWGRVNWGRAITLKEREAEERAKVGAKRCYGMQRAFRMGFERGSMAWEPQADRYVLMDCHRNQMSNRIRCIKNHLLVAGVFNRTLVVPLRANEVTRHYDRRTFFHLPHTRLCYGPSSAISLDDLLALPAATAPAAGSEPAPAGSETGATAEALSATVQVDQVLCLQKQCYNQSSASRDDLPSLSGITYPPNLTLTIGNGPEPLEIPKLLALQSLIQPTARVILVGDLGSVHLTFPGKNYLDVPFRQSPECPNALAVAPHPAILEAAREFVRSVVLLGARRKWEAADAALETEGGRVANQEQQQQRKLQQEEEGRQGGKEQEGRRAVGRYVGVHWRRTDLMQHSNPNARLSVEHAGACLVKAMGMAGNISTMFLASDTDDREVEALEKFMKERISGFKQQLLPPRAHWREFCGPKRGTARRLRAGPDSTGARILRVSIPRASGGEQRDGARMNRDVWTREDSASGRGRTGGRGNDGGSRGGAERRERGRYSEESVSGRRGFRGDGAGRGGARVERRGEWRRNGGVERPGEPEEGRGVKDTGGLVGEAGEGEQQGKEEEQEVIREEISPHRAGARCWLDAAVVRLLRVEQGGAYAVILSCAAAGEGLIDLFPPPSLPLSPLCHHCHCHSQRLSSLVAGVTRWRRYLDFLLSEFFSGSPSELDRMEPLLKQILRLGMFELAKMDTPPHAAVNEAVKLARAALRPGAASLANAILRAAVRAQEQGPLPAPSLHDAMTDRDKARALATLHSHPVWMVRRWADRLGWREAERLMESNNARPVFSLRANTAKGVSRSDLHSLLLALPEVEVEDSPYLDDFIRVKAGMQHVLTAGLIEDGSCNVQDESAGLVVRVLDPQPGETVVDCCAAPGGKAMYAAGLMQGTGRLVAVDVNEGRVRMVAQAAQRQGLQSTVECVVADLRSYAVSSPLRGAADRVLLDAPCSGLGVLAKRADLRWRRTVKGEAQLTALQDDLLDAAASLVRPGGLLVYSTCSIEPSENEDRITTFLQSHH
ncbi:unnamed protein product, partial [Closterium sp. Naga37s-1]